MNFILKIVESDTRINFINSFNDAFINRSVGFIGKLTIYFMIDTQYFFAEDLNGFFSSFLSTSCCFPTKMILIKTQNYAARSKPYRTIEMIQRAYMTNGFSILITRFFN